MIRATTIYLVRHGETDYNRDNVYQGTLDIPLNAAGRTQAMSLASRLSGVHFDAVYSSPLLRAKETAQIIARGIEVISTPELRELSYGSWQGLSESERRQRDTELDAQWSVEPWCVRFPAGETLEELNGRVSAALTRITNRHAGQTILLSGHGHVNRIILTNLIKLDRDQFWDIRQPNGCCYRITIAQIASSDPSIRSSTDETNSTLSMTEHHYHTSRVTYEYLS